MCWIGKKSEHTMCIAEQDISVYKIINKIEMDGFTTYCSLVFSEYYWHIDEMNEVILDIREDLSFIRIEGGFHSISSTNPPFLCKLVPDRDIVQYKKFTYNYGEDEFCVLDCNLFFDKEYSVPHNGIKKSLIYAKCIIPKGSLYYFNGYEYVSNKLVLKEVKLLNEVIKND